MYKLNYPNTLMLSIVVNSYSIAIYRISQACISLTDRIACYAELEYYMATTTRKKPVKNTVQKTTRELKKFLSSGGRENALKDFNAVLRKAIKVKK